MAHFNPLPPHGGRPYCHFFTHSIRHFNPLPPHGGRPDIFIPCHDRNFISIHSLRMEGDRNLMWCTQMENIFQSTPSAWRETCEEYDRPVSEVFQSTPSAWRETGTQTEKNRSEVISIHSLRMEGDPYAPRLRVCAGLFQSTPSAWRETRSRLTP